MPKGSDGSQHGLSEREQRFVEAYLLDPSPAKAATAAGYANWRSIGSQLLRRPRVEAALKEALAKRQERVEVKADRVLEELHRIALADMGGAFDRDGCLLPVADMPEDVRRAIAAIEVEETWSADGTVKTGRIVRVKWWDKNKGLELLAKHHGLLIEKHEHAFTFDTQEQRVAAVKALLGAGGAPALPDGEGAEEGT